MPLYGFKDEEIAKALKAFAQTKLLSGGQEINQSPPEVRDNTGGVFLIYTPLGGIPAATQDPLNVNVRTLGAAQCELLTTYSDTGSFIHVDGTDDIKAVPQLSYDIASTYTDETWQQNGTSTSWVYNASTDPIDESEFTLAVNVDGVMVVIPPGGGGGQETPRIQFVTTSKMVNRQCNGTCFRKIGLPVDGGNTPIVPGDTVQLNDPFNLWSNVEIGATGWAHYVPERLDSTDPNTTVHPARWEIESCSQPINRLEVRLQECLLPKTNTATTFNVAFAIDETLGDSLGAIPTQNSNIDFPPEAVFNDTVSCDYYSLTVKNPYNLDAIPGSMCIIERVTDLRPSEPVDGTDLNETTQFETPRARSSTTADWVITSVEKKYARHIKATYGGSWSKSQHYDGYWPPGVVGSCPELSLCADPTIECGGNCDCLETGDFGYGFLALQPDQSPKYIINSTQSALYGEAKDVIVATDVTMTGCTLGGSRSTIKTFCSPVSAGDVTGGVVGTKEVAVPTGTTIATETRSCTGDSCTWRWDYPETPCDNGGSVTYSWSVANQQWETSDTCPTGCMAPVPPDPVDTNTDGQDTVVQCVIQDTGVSLNWVKVSGCTNDCSCTTPATDGTTQGEFTTTPCPDNGTTEEYLCVTTSFAAVTVIDCATYGEGESAPAPDLDDQVSCIELTDECPDACEGIV